MGIDLVGELVVQGVVGVVDVDEVYDCLGWCRVGRIHRDSIVDWVLIMILVEWLVGVARNARVLSMRLNIMCLMVNVVYLIMLVMFEIVVLELVILVVMGRLMKVEMMNMVSLYMVLVGMSSVWERWWVRNANPMLNIALVVMWINKFNVVGLVEN